MRSASLFLLLSCALAGLFPAGSSADAPILDTEGKPLVRQDLYYVIAVADGPDVTVGIRSDDVECPRTVSLVSGRKDPVMFFPNRTNNRTILVDELLRVMFAELPPCPGFGELWTVNDTTGYVTTGGVIPPDSSDGDYGFFRIDRYDVPGPYYRLYSCPTPVDKHPCSTIGATPEGLLKRFPVPLVVQFEKVPDNLKMKIMSRKHLMRRQYAA